MDRRKFVSSLATASLLGTLANQNDLKSQTKNQGKIKPNVLSKGDTIGIITPGSAVSSPDDYQLAEEIADYLELKVKYASNVKKGSGYKTRTIQERVDDIHEMFSDQSISGIFCLRGGYGSAQLLDRISFGLIKKNPKVFLGFSDITALHLAIAKNSGLVTFHGPVMLSEFSRFTVTSLRKAIFSKKPIGIISNPADENSIRAEYPVRTINRGRAKGTLIGGNLSLICSLMGTRYEIETKNRIIFIEDVGEAPYMIDRMLTQLKLAGKLQAARGIVFGRCEDCKTGRSASTWDSSIGEVIDIIMSDIRIPAFYGLNFGHSKDQFTIPIGVEAEIDADKCTLSISESACI